MESNPANQLQQLQLLLHVLNPWQPIVVIRIVYSKSMESLYEHFLTMKWLQEIIQVISHLLFGTVLSTVQLTVHPVYKTTHRQSSTSVLNFGIPHCQRLSVVYHFSFSAYNVPIDKSESIILIQKHGNLFHMISYSI